MDLMRSRGTRYGLIRAIELGYGVTPQVTEDPARPFHVTVTLPAPGDDSPLSREGTERLLSQFLPAHVLYDLRFV